METRPRTQHGRTHGGQSVETPPKRNQGGHKADNGGHIADTWRTSSRDAAKAYRGQPFSSKKEPHSKLLRGKKTTKTTKTNFSPKMPSSLLRRVAPDLLHLLRGRLLLRINLQGLVGLPVRRASAETKQRQGEEEQRHLGWKTLLRLGGGGYSCCFVCVCFFLVFFCGLFWGLELGEWFRSFWGHV